MIIYIFAHIHSNAIGNGTDSFLLYYVSVLISAAVTSMGLWSYGIKKVRHHRAGAGILRAPRDSRYSSSSS